MHAERLHSIFSAIIADDSVQNYTALINTIVGAVNTRISQPPEPQHLQNIADSVKAFREAAKISETRNFSLTWKKIIAELGLEILLVEDVEQKIDEIFRSTSMEAEQKTELDKIVSERNSKKEAISQITEGFKKIEFKQEDLDPGEIVLHFSIPRDRKESDLKSFHYELGKLHKELLWISKAVKKESREFSIKSISSTDLNIVLNINVDLADIVLYVVMGLQLTLWQISKKEQAASEFSDAPKDLKDKMKEWVASLVDQKVKELYEEILKKYDMIIEKREYERNSEKIIGVFRDIAKKLQQGFGYDINAGRFEVEEPSEENGAKTATKAELALRERINSISQQSSDLRVLQAQENDILSLPIPEEGSEITDELGPAEPTSPDSDKE